MRVILHIGTEKTATTTLQEFVYANRRALLRHGIALSDRLGKTNNRVLASYCMPEENFDDYFKDLRISTAAQKKAHFAGFKEAFIEEVKALPPSVHTLFITSEHFHSRLKDVESVRRLKAVLDEITGDITVLCWFREQSAVVRSLYSTAVKSGNTLDIQTFARKCEPRNRYFNYFEMLSTWREVFGAAALRPRLFAAEHFVGGDIRRDLLAQVLPEPADAGFDFSGEAANRSLGRVGIDLGRITNRVFGRYNVNGTLNQARRRVMAVVIGSELGQSGTIALPEAVRIHERFDASNRRFAAEFLGRQDNPFPPPRSPSAADDAAAVDLAPLLAFYEQLMVELKPSTRAADEARARRVGELAAQIRSGVPLDTDAAGLLDEVAALLMPSRPDTGPDAAPAAGAPWSRLLRRLLWR